MVPQVVLPKYMESSMNLGTWMVYIFLAVSGGRGRGRGRDGTNR
jgi:hypothetical protein